MTPAAADRWSGTPARFAAAHRLRRWTPLHTWGARRRLALAGVTAAVAGALAVGVCATVDFAGAAAADARLAAARRELAEARRAQRMLPALRRAAASDVPRDPRRTGSSADDARHVSELAASAGVSLVSLEPGPGPGPSARNGGPNAKPAQRVEASRVLKLGAEGDFSRLRSFLRGLARAPALIVPTEVVIGRRGPQLSLAATLAVFDALPSIAVADDASAPADPFATNPANGLQTGDGFRLAGLMQDRTRAVALIETAAGTSAVEAGSRIEGERVVRIAGGEVTLSAGSTMRTLKWAEGER